MQYAITRLKLMEKRRLNKKMPQLDSLTYSTQFIWFIVIFLGFYLLLSNDTIPHVGAILKTRNKLIKNAPVYQNIETKKTNFESLLINNLINNKK